jgi:hypothetical protein
MADAVEFASPDWMTAVAEVLVEALRGLDTDGATYSVSEEFTDPPAHLLADGATSIGWHFRVTDGTVAVGDGPLADADLVTTVDYDTVLPLARLVYDSPEAMEQLQRTRAEATAAGKLTRTGDESALPPELMQRLFDVHNEMARRTQ